MAESQETPLLPAGGVHLLRSKSVTLPQRVAVASHFLVRRFFVFRLAKIHVKAVHCINQLLGLKTLRIVPVGHGVMLMSNDLSNEMFSDT